MLEGVNINIPLEGDIVPLEDCEEGDKPIVVSTLVGKIICMKTITKDQ